MHYLYLLSNFTCISHPKHRLPTAFHIHVSSLSARYVLHSLYSYHQLFNARTLATRVDKYKIRSYSVFYPLPRSVPTPPGSVLTLTHTIVTAKCRTSETPSLSSCIYSQCEKQGSKIGNKEFCKQEQHCDVKCVGLQFFLHESRCHMWSERQWHSPRNPLEFSLLTTQLLFNGIPSAAPIMRRWIRRLLWNQKRWGRMPS